MSQQLEDVTVKALPRMKLDPNLLKFATESPSFVFKTILSAVHLELTQGKLLRTVKYKLENFHEEVLNR